MFKTEKVNLSVVQRKVYEELANKILSVDEIKNWLESKKTFLDSLPDLWSGNYTKESEFIDYIAYCLKKIVELASFHKHLKKAVDTFRNDFSEKEVMNWLFEYEEYGLKTYDFGYDVIIDEDAETLALKNADGIKISTAEFRNIIAFNKIFNRLYWNRYKRYTRKIIRYNVNGVEHYTLNHPYPTLKKLYDGIRFVKA